MWSVNSVSLWFISSSLSAAFLRSISTIRGQRWKTCPAETKKRCLRLCRRKSSRHILFSAITDGSIRRAWTMGCPCLLLYHRTRVFVNNRNASKCENSEKLAKQCWTKGTKIEKEEHGIPTQKPSRITSFYRTLSNICSDVDCEHFSGRMVDVEVSMLMFHWRFRHQISMTEIQTRSWTSEISTWSRAFCNSIGDEQVTTRRQKSETAKVC